MKFFAIFLTFIVSLLILLYVTLFTPLGNNFLKPFIEQEIQKQTTLDSSLKLFSLDSNSVELLLFLNKDNSIYFKANYSLIHKSFNGAYRIKLLALQTLKPLTNTALQGRLKSEGKVVGDVDSFTIEGVSNIASSDAKYKIKVEKLKLNSIQASIASAHLKELLFMLKKKAYVGADVNIDINFKDIRAHKLDGHVRLRTSKGVFNTQLMQEDFNITIPKKTLFSLGADVKLAGDDVNYTYVLNSNLVNMKSKGRVTPEPFSVDATFDMHAKELARLRSLRLNGSVIGSKKKLIVDVKTDLAESQTTLQLILANLHTESLNIDIKGLKIQKALYMLNLPPYTDGLVDMQAILTGDTMKNLAGTVNTTLTQGQVNSKYLSNTFAFSSPMPTTDFTMNTFTKFQNGYANSKVDFHSNIADFYAKQLRYTLADASIESDYSVKVKELQKLYFLTSRKLKGRLLAKGELKKAENLDLTLRSKIAGGTLNVVLHNNDLKANFHALNSLKLLDILYYPKLFAAKIDGVLKYDLEQSKGSLEAKLSEGKFTKNKVFDLTKKYAHIDLYKENFSGDVDAKIVAEQIVASLLLKSNTSSIKSNDAKINIKNNTLDAVVDISANKNPIKIKLLGDINAPKVIISADELLRRKATKVITKEVNKFLKHFF